MAGKSDFTEEEWETMHKGVTGAGLLMSVSDRGFLDSFKEAGALARHLAERGSSAQQYERGRARARGDARDRVRSDFLTGRDRR
jgi:hypothetical protein